MQQSRDIKTIQRDHLTLIRGVIDRIMKKSRSQEEIANLDRLKKRITLLLQTMGEDALIVQITPFMITHAEAILKRDEEFFLSLNARQEYIAINKREPPPDDEFAFLLIDSIRALYKKITQKDRDELYADVVKIFNCCIEYKIAAPDRFVQ